MGSSYWKLCVIIPVAGVLAGCETTGTGSITGGECKIFERPEYAVRGLKTYDQDWIDSQVEGGIGGCKWARPKARPAELDAQPGVKLPAPKKTLVQRIKAKVIPKPRPVAAQPPPVVAAAPIPYLIPEKTPAPPKPPRDPVDELLNPS